MHSYYVTGEGNPWNRQTMFDAVWDHFITKKNPRSIKPGIGDSNACKYRDGQGNACAVGILFPDDMYSPRMEDCGNIGFVIEDALTMENREFYNPRFVEMCRVWNLAGYLPFLVSLQTAHDYPTYGPDDDERFLPETGLRAIAAQYNLTIPGEA